MFFFLFSYHIFVLLYILVHTFIHSYIRWLHSYIRFIHLFTQICTNFASFRTYFQVSPIYFSYSVSKLFFMEKWLKQANKFENFLLTHLFWSLCVNRRWNCYTCTNIHIYLLELKYFCAISKFLMLTAFPYF